MRRLLALIVVAAIGVSALLWRTSVPESPEMRHRIHQEQPAPEYPEEAEPQRPNATRTFVGHVVAEQGGAVAGANVVLRHPIGTPRAGLVWERQTDSEGYFVVDDVPEERQWVARIRHPDFLPLQVEAFDPTTREDPFVLSAGVIVRGDVRGALEQRLEHARVCLLDRRYDPPIPLAGDPQFWTRSCDRDSGAFELGPVPAGEYTIAAVAPGFPRLLRDLPALASGQNLAGVELRMGLGHLLNGRVRDADGVVLAGVDVTLRQPARNEMGMVGLLLPQTETATDGTFQIAGLEEGRYRVRVAHPDFTPRVIRWHTDEGEPLQITLEEFGEIKGQVVDDISGQPIEEFLIFITPLLPDLPDHPRGKMLSTFRVTDENGLFQIREIDAGPYELSVEARGYAPRDIGPIEVDGELVELGFRLQRGAHVFGRVIDARGEPVLGVSVAKEGEGWRSHTRDTRAEEELRPWVNGVELRGLRASGIARHRFVTGDSGEFRLGPFGDEEIDISFHHDLYLAKTLRGVTIRASEERELPAVILEPATSLVIRGPRNPSWLGGTVSLLEPDSGELISRQVLSHRPVVVIHSLPDGVLRLHWSREDGSTIRDIEVELQLQQPAEIQLQW